MPLGNAGRCADDCARTIGEHIADNFWSEQGGDPGSLADETAGPRQVNLLTRHQYQNAVTDLLGVNADNITANFPTEARVKGFSNNAGKNYVTARHFDEYMRAGEKLAADAVSQRKSALLSCDENNNGCAQQFVEDFGRRAFRRPLSNEERNGYVSLFEEQGDFHSGMTAVIEAMLISPNYLYINELGEAQGNGVYELTPYEVASQLSFIFQDTIPDDALLAAAASWRPRSNWPARPAGCWRPNRPAYTWGTSPSSGWRPTPLPWAARARTSIRASTVRYGMPCTGSCGRSSPK